MENNKIYKLKCKRCGKIIASLNKNQAKYNMVIHKIKCNKKEQQDEWNNKNKENSENNEENKDNANNQKVKGGVDSQKW